MADKMERQLKELTLSYRTRYTGKDIKENLKHILSEKVIHRDQLTELSEVLKIKRHKLKIAVEAAQAYLRIQPPHQTIGDAVVMALAMSNYQSGQGQGKSNPCIQFNHASPLDLSDYLRTYTISSKAEAYKMNETNVLDFCDLYLGPPLFVTFSCTHLILSSLQYIHQCG